MVKSFLSENEAKEFKDKMQATSKDIAKHGVEIVPPEHIQYNPMDVIQTFYTERLVKSSERLNHLTIALIVLTVVLAVLTLVLVRESLGF